MSSFSASGQSLPHPPVIASPEDPALAQLAAELAARADQVDLDAAWPAWQLDRCAAYGVHAWFLPADCGGQQWSEADILRGYVQLSAGCLTTAFILTQRAGACRRIAGSGNATLAARLLPDLIAGRSFATVGISHLTTSRRHLARPVLRAEEVAEGWRLTGLSPWVTGARHAEHIVIGAALDDDRQVLVALPTELSGVTTPPPARLVGLSASHTGEVHCDGVVVPRANLIAGPIENVMSHGSGAGTGGLQTSALALGLTQAAVAFLQAEGRFRPELLPPAESLAAEQRSLVNQMLALADSPTSGLVNEFRAAANSLVLRATQASLAAAKGAGYVAGHPAGRWCREALFFLVWSCPQPVLAANLCELANLA